MVLNRQRAAHKRWIGGEAAPSRGRRSHVCSAVSTESIIKPVGISPPFDRDHPLPQPPIAELVAVQTSPGCVSCRLLVRDEESLTAPPHIVWMNRAFADIPASHAGCRARAQAWAPRAGYRNIEGKEGQRKQA